MTDKDKERMRKIEAVNDWPVVRAMLNEGRKERRKTI